MSSPILQSPILQYALLLIAATIFLLVVTRTIIRPAIKKIAQAKFSLSDAVYRISIFIERFDSKSWLYFAGIILIVGFSFYNAVRAFSVYYKFFDPIMGTETIFGYPILLTIVSAVAFIIVLVGSFYVSVFDPQKQQRIGWWIALIVVLLHDWGGIAYNLFFLDWEHPTSKDWGSLVVAGGFCLLTTLPIIFGRWLPYLRTERKTELTQWRATYDQHIEQRVEDRALATLENIAHGLPVEKLGGLLSARTQKIGTKIIEAYTGTAYAGVPSVAQAIIGQQQQPQIPAPEPKTTKVLPEEDNSALKKLEDQTKLNKNTLQEAAAGQNEDKLNKALAWIKDHPQSNDEELAEHLNLTKPASARFWRLKAIEIIDKESSPKAEDSKEGGKISPFVMREGGINKDQQRPALSQRQ